MSIYLMKVGPYKPFLEYRGFNDLCNLALQLYDPGIYKDQIEKFMDKEIIEKKIDMIFCSNLRRGIETAQFIKNKNASDPKIKIEMFLNEILFDLNRMCTPNQYSSFKSKLIRKKFIEYFIEDKLPERLFIIKYKFDQLIHLLNINKHKNILVISHTFFLKLFLIYFNHQDLFENPEIIKKYINPKKKIMRFGHLIKFKRCKILKESWQKRV